jgi:hypothetical protein
MRPTTPPTAAPAMAPVDIGLDSVAAAAPAASKAELREGEAETSDVEDVDSRFEDDEVGDGVDVGQPIMEGEVRAQPSIGWA